MIKGSKKLVVAAIMLSMILALTACGSNKSNNSAGDMAGNAATENNQGTVTGSPANNAADTGNGVQMMSMM